MKEASNIVWPEVEEGHFTAMVVVEEGQGFPRLCKRSHTTRQMDRTSVTAHSAEDFPKDEGSVVVFDSRIARQDPAVMPGKGATAMLMLY